MYKYRETVELGTTAMAPAAVRALIAEMTLRWPGASYSLLTRNCARCHAIGRAGNSPRPDAPAFRTLGQRYPIEALEEALGEGIMSGHPDMPEFEFDADQVGAIIAFLESIQQR